MRCAAVRRGDAVHPEPVRDRRERPSSSTFVSNAVDHRGR
jgi:hypothetical protein